jgi:hypothetical protein
MNNYKRKIIQLVFKTVHASAKVKKTIISINKNQFNKLIAQFYSY